ncbi:MAG: TolC family protein [Burkholderiales bacterium]|nr:TolC family protein [Flavobacterium sp.]
MKSNSLLFLVVFLLGILHLKAQQKTSLSLHDAVAMALDKSDEVGLAMTRVDTKNFELQAVKNNRYPDLKVSGQYLRLTNAKIEMKNKANSSGSQNMSSQSSGSLKVNELILGQANMNLPLFSGFKLKSSISASENLYQAEIANANYTKEETAMKVVQYYADLYKAQKSVALFKENLKSGQQRVVDFQALEQNGIIARNDFLKSQLQVSKIQLSVDEAEKNVKLLNYYLITLLKLTPETQIEVSPSNIDPNLFTYTVQTQAQALESRKDLEAVRFLSKATTSNIKVAIAGYYPGISFVSGYTALNLQNVVTVENAVNVGVGLTYNLSSIFKNGKEVKAAKSKAVEVEKQQALLKDNIKFEITQAREEYALSLKQDQVYSEAVAQATENYRIVKDKYDNGLSNTNDLLEADVEQLGAQINQAYAKANVALKYYELLYTSGQLIESFKLTQNQ